METRIMRVVQQGEPVAVQSQKAEGGQLMRCSIVLHELDKYGDQFVATLLGDAAMLTWSVGALVAVTLRCTTREYNGSQYQDILVGNIERLR